MPKPAAVGNLQPRAPMWEIITERNLIMPLLALYGRYYSADQLPSFEEFKTCFRKLRMATEGKDLCCNQNHENDTDERN